MKNRLILILLLIILITPSIKLDNISERKYTKPNYDYPSFDSFILSYLYFAPFNTFYSEMIEYDFIKGLCEYKFNKLDEYYLFKPNQTEEFINIQKEFRRDSNNPVLSAQFFPYFVGEIKSFQTKKVLIDNFLDNIKMNINLENEFLMIYKDNKYVNEDVRVKRMLLNRIKLKYFINLRYDETFHDLKRCLKDVDNDIGTSDCLDIVARNYLYKEVFFKPKAEYQYNNFESECNDMYSSILCQNLTSMVKDIAKTKLTKPCYYTFYTIDPTQSLEDIAKQIYEINRKSLDTNYIRFSKNIPKTLHFCEFPDLYYIFIYEIAMSMPCKAHKYHELAVKCRNYSKYNILFEECNVFNFYNCKELKGYDQMYYNFLQKIMTEYNQITMEMRFKQKAKINLNIFNTDSKLNQLYNEVKQYESKYYGFRFKENPNYRTMMKNEMKESNTNRILYAKGIYKVRDFIEELQDSNPLYIKLLSMYVLIYFIQIQSNVFNMYYLLNIMYEYMKGNSDQYEEGNRISIFEMIIYLNTLFTKMRKYYNDKFFYITYDYTTRKDEIYYEDQVDYLRDYCIEYYPETYMEVQEYTNYRNFRKTKFIQVKLIQEFFSNIYNPMDLDHMVPNLDSKYAIFLIYIRNLYDIDYSSIFFFLFVGVTQLYYFLEMFNLATMMIVLIACKQSNHIRLAENILYLNNNYEQIKLVQDNLVPVWLKALFESNYTMLSNPSYIGFKNTQIETYFTILSFVSSLIASNGEYQIKYTNLMCGFYYMILGLDLSNFVKKGWDFFDFTKEGHYIGYLRLHSQKLLLKLGMGGKEQSENKQMSVEEVDELNRKKKQSNSTQSKTSRFLEMKQMQSDEEELSYKLDKLNTMIDAGL